MASRAYLAALQVGSYRWLLLNTFSLSAAWTAESIATGWLVLQLTDSPFWLGVLVAARGVSQLLFSVIGGTLVDRADTRRLLIHCQLVAVVIWAWSKRRKAEFDELARMPLEDDPPVEDQGSKTP